MSQHDNPTPEPDRTQVLPAGEADHETGRDSGETTVIPTEEHRSAPSPEPTAPVPPVAQPPAVAAPAYKSGPAPTTSVIGLLGLLTAIAVIVGQATDLDIRWGVVGPVAVVGAGVLLVVLGLAGLRGQQFRG
ncbi:hypothetical protein BCF74_10810 [Knoellia remsis]|uniref:Uncharacterized protein n=1 Tax=Knoellia remsis TaxID=407159 RepID=A0A2T0UQ85_9MICO|nr:hypothetical protein [Knoellia remsis]PRY60066.1 hypothetical protein BCF74_10810 [Knoellia remsis]